MVKKIKTKRTMEEKVAEKRLVKKAGLMMDIPQECRVCQKVFDKTDRSMVESWYVIVREKEKEVHLYCPECYEVAQRMVEDYYGRKEMGSSVSGECIEGEGRSE